MNLLKRPAPRALPGFAYIVRFEITSLSPATTGGPTLIRARFPASRSFLEAMSLEISGGRSQKGPLTHSAEFFAVRHRLLENVLASAPTRPVAPFTVELFTFGGLGRYPGPGIGLGSLCHHNRGSLREPG